MTKSNSMTVSIVVSSCFVFAFVPPQYPVLLRINSVFLSASLLAILSLILYFLPNTGEPWFVQTHLTMRFSSNLHVSH